MNPPFFWGLFATMVGGSVAGVFYPIVVRAFKNSTQDYFWDLQQSKYRWLIAAASGLFIGLILAGISFAAFLGSVENQLALAALGGSAFFLAFTAGFTASSAAEELLKK